MIEGVVLHDSAFQDTKTIDINNIITPDENIRAIKESREFKTLLDSFDEIRDSYISVIELHDGSYRLIDGLQRFLIYRDYEHIENIKCAVLHDIDFNMDDLRFAIRSSLREKGLANDLKRFRIASKFVNKIVLNDNASKIIARMLDMSPSNVYRLSNIDKHVNPKLLDVCLEREISVRGAEAVASLTVPLQDALYQELHLNSSLKPTEQLVKTIKYRDKVTADYEPEESTSIPSRTLGRARRDRKIIEEAIEFDRQRGIPIKDIDNVSSKITISNLIAKQEDAVRALENRIYRMDYEASPIDISRIETVIQRLNGVIEQFTRNK